ncbi:MAG: type II secretion system protein GspM [Silvania sp.]|uniref:type II secretion system protein GspM n=1 Tax=Silvania sp. TaxID=3016633 RepID=UPI003EE74CFF
MKERVAQLKARYQAYSAREKQLMKFCGAALCCAVVYYGGMVPLDNMIKNSQATLKRQTETLIWMRGEINKNHLQVQQTKTDNPRSVVENSAREIQLPLNDVRQEGQSLSFIVPRVEINALKNWLREINAVSGIRLEKMKLTPVDHQRDVRAEIQLSWKKAA